jgi:hypothetical protein
VRKHRKLLTILLVSPVVGGLLWLLLPDSEPRYNGHSLSYWVTIRGDYNDVPVVQLDAAEDAIAHIGTNAIPYLLDWATYEPSPTLKFTRRVFWKNGLRKRPMAVNLLFTQEDRADGLFEAFTVLGPVAAPALPELARITTNSTRHPIVYGRTFSCIWAILLSAEQAKHDTPHSELLTAALTNTDPTIRFAAKYVLSIRALRSTNTPPQ